MPAEEKRANKVSISPTFYTGHFCTKVMHEALLYLQILGLSFFLRQNIGASAFMLVKLTTGGKPYLNQTILL
jgi:hypothetical protein